MAVIIQSDPYLALIRKIGYSVGLESIVERISIVVDKYVSKRELNSAMWLDIVKSDYNRKIDAPYGKKNAAEHIADFMSTIKILGYIGREVVPLEGLETLSILKRYYNGETYKYKRALKYVVLNNLLEADGDIFLNCLYSNFEINKTKHSLKKMVEYKRSTLCKIIKNPGLQNKIFNVVSIKTQQSSKGLGDNPFFQKRTEPLNIQKRTKPLNNSKKKISEDISKDYLKKTLQTRKGWAKDIDLIEDDSISDIGNGLIDFLRKSNLYHDNIFAFWPYKADLEQMRIKGTDLNTDELTPWSLLKTLYMYYSHNDSLKEFRYFSSEHETIKLFKKIYSYYKSGSKIKGAIRHQLPLYIAFPTIVAICLADSYRMIELPDMIDRITKGKNRTMNIINVRGTDGALAFKD